MSVHTSQFEAFKTLLDREHIWPGQYVFKFIVKKSELDQATDLFEGDSIEFKESGSGKYVSLTLTKVMDSSEGVIAVYKKASVIPGIIVL